MENESKGEKVKDKKKLRTITVPPNHSWNKPLLQEAAASEIHDQGTTALHEASRNGHTEITELLLNHGASVDAVSLRGRTPLHCAAYKGFVEPVKVLLAHGANYNLHSFDGRTALHDAALMGHTEVAIVLLEAGADPDLRTYHNSFAPVDVAATKKLTKIIETIVSNVTPFILRYFCLLYCLRILSS